MKRQIVISPNMIDQANLFGGASKTFTLNSQPCIELPNSGTSGIRLGTALPFNNGEPVRILAYYTSDTAIGDFSVKVDGWGQIVDSSGYEVFTMPQSQPTQAPTQPTILKKYEHDVDMSSSEYTSVVFRRDSTNVQDTCTGNLQVLALVFEYSTDQ